MLINEEILIFFGIMLIEAILFKPKFVRYNCNELCKTGPRGRAASGLQLSVAVSIDRRGSIKFWTKQPS